MVYGYIGPSQCFCLYEIIDRSPFKLLADRLCSHFVRAIGHDIHAKARIRMVILHHSFCVA